MRVRGRQTAAAKSATADLFAATRPEAEARSTVEAPPVPETRPECAVPRHAAHALVRKVPPLPQPRPQPRKQLWYAVVFPELSEPQRPASQRPESPRPESQRPAPQAASLLQRCGLLAQQFTSLVSLETPNALLLEIKGSVQLFGSLARLHEAIDAAWCRSSLRTQSATAPTTLAALWLARAGQRVCIEDPGLLAGGLAELPIASTSWNPDWLQTLRAMGVTRLGQLLRLPRAGVARRLGAAAVLDIDIALARQAAPRRAFLPRERFRERCDFETEIETVVYLQKALEPVVERCAQFLRERQAGVQALELRLLHRARPATRARVGLASITSERHRLADVLHEKLNRLELAAPVRGMELRSGPTRPLPSDSLDAFAGLRAGGMRVGGLRACDAAPQLVERLRARLGEDAVYGVVCIADHRPEAAWRRVQALHLASAARVTGERPSEMSRPVSRNTDARLSEMPRPVWLLGRPELLAADLRHVLQQGLLLEQGPERIESGWWDGKGVARDYYIARRLQGARWWIFQERQTQSWYLHGVFA
jgi:protein ImuB